MARARRSLLLSLLGTLACVAEEPSGSGPATTTGSTSSDTTGPGSTGPVATNTTASSVGSTTADPSTTGLDSSGTAAETEGPIFDVGTIPDVPDPPLPATDIDVVITADNAYAFGYGSQLEMSNYFGGVAATLASEIFSCGSGPESYLVPAEDTAEYLYIVSYADNATTQGVIGQFRRINGDGTPGEVVYTGDAGWEVCATGVDYGSGDPTPPLMVVNEQIALCNAGASDPATTSGGWVDEVGTPLGALAVGETNDTPYMGGAQPGNEFPLVCQTLVDPQARWMWFNWDPAGIVWPAQSPFIYPGGAGNPMHDFMIFRLASDAVPPPPAG
ncbi:MAG: hypothetical protein AB1Z98_00320 [Nannocystaceae bacterium]